MHTKKPNGLLCAVKEKNEKPVRSMTYFPRVMLIVKSNWRVKSHLRLGTYLKVHNLISKAYRTNTTVWLSTPHELLPQATLMGHSLLAAFRAI